MILLFCFNFEKRLIYIQNRCLLLFIYYIQKYKYSFLHQLKKSKTCLSIMLPFLSLKFSLKLIMLFHNILMIKTLFILQKSTKLKVNHNWFSKNCYLKIFSSFHFFICSSISNISETKFFQWNFLRQCWSFVNIFFDWWIRLLKKHANCVFTCLSLF
jgi:hypothetical protein